MPRKISPNKKKKIKRKKINRRTSPRRKNNDTKLYNFMDRVRSVGDRFREIKPNRTYTNREIFDWFGDKRPADTGYVEISGSSDDNDDGYLEIVDGPNPVPPDAGYVEISSSSDDNDDGYLEIVDGPNPATSRRRV